MAIEDDARHHWQFCVPSQCIRSRLQPSQGVARQSTNGQASLMLRSCPSMIIFSMQTVRSCHCTGGEPCSQKTGSVCLIWLWTSWNIFQSESTSGAFCTVIKQQIALPTPTPFWHVQRNRHQQEHQWLSSLWLPLMTVIWFPPLIILAMFASNKRDWNMGNHTDAAKHAAYYRSRAADRSTYLGICPWIIELASGDKYFIGRYLPGCHGF